MCSTPYGISYRITLSAATTSPAAGECSTPYGISYRITQEKKFAS